MNVNKLLVIKAGRTMNYPCNLPLKDVNTSCVSYHRDINLLNLQCMFYDFTTDSSWLVKGAKQP